MEPERKSRYELWLEEQETPKEKRCSKCGEYKPLGEYHKQKSGLYGVTARCKNCVSRRKYRNRADRFWKSLRSRTQNVGNCIEWTGAYSKTGHPSCRWEGRSTVMVRRIIYRLAVGELSDDMMITTTCRNKRCVRQSHLKLVTKEEIETIRCNSLATGERSGAHTHPERWKKGDDHWARSHPELVARGERHGCAKLTEFDVRVIKQRIVSGEDKSEIAAALGVSPSTIRRIATGKLWAHVK